MILYHILPLAVNTRRRKLRSHSPLPVPCLLFLMRPNTGQPCSFATTAGLGVRRPLVIHQYDFEPPSCPTRLALASLRSAAAPASAARGTSLPRRRPTLSLSSFASSRLLSKAQSSRTCRGHLWRGAASAEYLLLAPPPQLSTPCANRILPSRCVRPPLARCLLRQHPLCAYIPRPANQRSGRA